MSSGVTDLAMFGRPQTDAEMRKRVHRGFYLLAGALEVAQEFALELRANVAAPEGLRSRPDLADDLDRTILALTKLTTWAWDAPKSNAAPPEAPR